MTISIATMYEALMTRLLSMDPSSVEARRLYVKAFYPGRRKAHGRGLHLLAVCMLAARRGPAGGDRVLGNNAGLAGRAVVCSFTM